MVAFVAVVVGREEVAIGVECQLLRVSQSSGDNLERRSVRLATKDRPCPWPVQGLSLASLEMKTSVADRKIELAVRPPYQAVQIMAEETRVHAKPELQALASICQAIAIFVAQQPEVGDAREVDVTVASQNTRGEPVERTVESAGEDRRAVGAPVAVAVLKHSHLVGIP